ncbi:hypothetical protein VIGAN_01127900, partial [Vigna angularis var. angularis]
SVPQTGSSDMNKTTEATSFLLCPSHCGSSVRISHSPPHRTDIQNSQNVKNIKTLNLLRITRSSELTHSLKRIYYSKITKIHFPDYNDYSFHHTDFLDIQKLISYQQPIFIQIL